MCLTKVYGERAEVDSSTDKKDFRMMKPASAPPSPSLSRASTPQVSDGEEDDDDTHLYDDEDEGIQFKAEKDVSQVFTGVSGVNK